jgi:2-deoxy-D-gluconate 3-dehydrogenase
MTATERPLAGRRALVTGASRGIGRAVAERLASLGADLALVQRGEAGETQAAMIRPARVVRCDLSRGEDAELAVERAVEALGGLDICVCNAGAIARAPALETTVAEFRRIVELDLVSTFAVARAAARLMPDGGSIVLVASVLAFQGGIRVPAYAASKAGVANLARALANEWAPLGIRVNAVAPGYVENDQTAPLRADDTRRREIEARIPAGRWAANEDVSAAVAWLVSEDSAYVHGHVLVVDGGWLGR